MAKFMVDMRLKRITTPFIILLLLSSCSAQSVQPWQKQDLSRPEMQFDFAPTQRSFENQFYHSKEGSSGGDGFAGSGCGCN